MKIAHRLIFFLILINCQLVSEVNAEKNPQTINDSTVKQAQEEHTSIYLSPIEQNNTKPKLGKIDKMMYKSMSTFFNDTGSADLAAPCIIVLSLIGLCGLVASMTSPAPSMNPLARILVTVGSFALFIPLLTLLRTGKSPEQASVALKELSAVLKKPFYTLDSMLFNRQGQPLFLWKDVFDIKIESNGINEPKIICLDKNGIKLFESDQLNVIVDETIVDLSKFCKIDTKELIHLIKRYLMKYGNETIKNKLESIS